MSSYDESFFSFKNNANPYVFKQSFRSNLLRSLYRIRQRWNWSQFTNLISVGSTHRGQNLANKQITSKAANPGPEVLHIVSCFQSPKANLLSLLLTVFLPSRIKKVTKYPQITLKYLKLSSISAILGWVSRVVTNTSMVFCFVNLETTYRNEYLQGRKRCGRGNGENSKLLESLQFWLAIFSSNF